jgi:hypothetical protein
VRLGAEAFQKRGREPRFADAGLAREQDHLVFTSLRFAPAPQQQFGFLFSSDEGGQAGGVKRCTVPTTHF